MLILNKKGSAKSEAFSWSFQSEQSSDGSRKLRSNFLGFPRGKKGLAAPTIGGSNAFGDYAKPLHIQSSGTSGYNVSPWTNVAKFSSIIQDL